MTVTRVRSDCDIAALSAMRLARLERPHEVRAYRVSDEVLVCGGCGFVIVESPEGWRHSQAEIDAMRAIASGRL